VEAVSLPGFDRVTALRPSIAAPLAEIRRPGRLTRAVLRTSPPDRQKCARSVPVASSPTSRIRHRFWGFCDFPVTQASDLSINSFMKVARIGCSEDLVPSPGRILMYWSAPPGFFHTHTGNDRGKSPISGNPRWWNNCHNAPRRLPSGMLVACTNCRMNAPVANAVFDAAGKRFDPPQDDLGGESREDRHAISVHWRRCR
jgi:hypothetical protein